MIHMSQVKVPLEKLLEKVPQEMLKKGTIGEKERKIVLASTAKQLKISSNEIKEFTIEKKSLDARKKNQIQYIYRVSLHCNKEQNRVKKYGKNDAKWIPDDKEDTAYAFPYRMEKKPDISPVVVGFGPAGMFAALELAKAGLCPYVIERGMEVDLRQKVVDSFWKGEKINPECNVQFGEGGAGTFSDGKLNTMVKDPTGRNKQVLQTFVDFGAPGEILYLQKPHIGTDCLRNVVKAIRQEIIKLGGHVLFETKLEDFVVENNKIVQIKMLQKGREVIKPCQCVILATGHSARDTFYKLQERGMNIEPKAFAMGVRIEHPQEMIGKNQYGEYYKNLPTADYKLTYQTKQGRGVYSFCMCPGGYVVNASSEKGRLAVNGMSYSKRDGQNANSAIVVTVNPSDFGGKDALAGVSFQRKLEEIAFCQGKGKIPVQLFGDFLEKKVSTSFGEFLPNMKGEYSFGNVREIYPEFIGDALAEGIQAFDRKMKGFARKDAILSGIESRTSSPIRMIRDDTLQSSILGIYPCGEGAGYAGGITSAAMDGIRVAQQIIETEERK